MAQLSASGEDVVGSIKHPQFLLLARTLLLGTQGSAWIFFLPGNLLPNLVSHFICAA